MKVRRSNSKALTALLKVHIKAEYEFWQACKEMGHWDGKSEVTASLVNRKSVKFSYVKEIEE
jgi:hypothetical protein